MYTFVVVVFGQMTVPDMPGVTGIHLSWLMKDIKSRMTFLDFKSLINIFANRSPEYEF